MRTKSNIVLTWLLLMVTPTWLSAQGTGAAVLLGTGSVYQNGSQVSTSSAITPGDVIQTKDSGAANISAPGSTVVVESNSIVRYQAEGFALDRGNISVATGRGMTVNARDFKITPVSQDWTEFYVTRSNGSIGIMARKGAVTVHCGSRTETIKQGQQISREDAANCGAVAKDAGATPAAKGALLTSTTAALVATGAGAVVVGLVLTRGDDVSPSKP